jgi:hypothetical protein
LVNLPVEAEAAMINARSRRGQGRHFVPRDEGAATAAYGAKLGHWFAVTRNNGRFPSRRITAVVSRCVRKTGRRNDRTAYPSESSMR